MTADRKGIRGAGIVIGKTATIVPIESGNGLPDITPLDCSKSAFKHLSTKHGRSFVTMDSRPLPRIWEK